MEGCTELEDVCRFVTRNELIEDQCLINPDGCVGAAVV